MCNLYSNQAAIIALFRVMNRYVGNLPPMPGVFPDYPAPVVRNAAGERELTMMRWGMSPPPRAGGFPVTNIRNTTSPHWRGWLKPENRCLVPANSFAEYAPEPNPERQAATRAKAERSGADKICRLLKASPSMWAFIVAIIVFGLTLVISILLVFRYGMSDNQSLPPSTAAETTFTVGTLIAFAIAASHWLPQLGW